MNKRERVRMAAAHQQPDKVPCSIRITNHALATLAHYVGEPRLEDLIFFA